METKMKVRAVIDAVGFAELCAGKQITLEGRSRRPVPGYGGSVVRTDDVDVELILSDIGFKAMQAAVDRAVYRASHKENEP